MAWVVTLPRNRATQGVRVSASRRRATPLATHVGPHVESTQGGADDVDRPLRRSLRSDPLFDEIGPHGDERRFGTGPGRGDSAEFDAHRCGGLGRLDIEENLDAIFVNAVFNFHRSEGMVPYFLAGLGAATREQEIEGLSVDEDSTAYLVGAGSRIFLGRYSRLAFRVEALYMIEDTFDETAGHFAASVGLTWRIGAAP